MAEQANKDVASEAAAKAIDHGVAMPMQLPAMSDLHRSPRLLRLLAFVAKTVATLAAAGVAGVVALMTWQYYVTSPWTRNGVVRVQVANVAPQVSGQIIRLHVSDNQFVRQGDVLYEIDPFNFETAARTAQAAVDEAAADAQVKQAQSDRRQHLSNAATTPEEQQIFAGSALQAKATYDAATQQLAQAQINLQRSKVTSPVSGYVTNLLLRVGDFAATGSSNISVVDSDSFWIDGYFEETKLAQICIEDRVEAKLMSFDEPIKGHVDTITRGISVGNAAAGTQGLPSVNPIYTWVQLAQRVPVRIAIDSVPTGIPLVSGMTATVTINPVEDSVQMSPLDAIKRQFDQLPQLFNSPMTRQHCLGATLQSVAKPEALATPQTERSPPIKDIDPGLVPGLNQSPQIN